MARQVRRGSDGEAKDPFAVVVLDERIARDRAVAAADAQDRELAVERHQPFEDRGHLTDRAPCVLRQHGVVDHRLSLAVVAQPTRLQHGRRPDPFHRRTELVRRRHRFVRSGRQAHLVEERLLVHPVLGDLERLRGREDRRELHQEASGLDGHVLELERHHVGAVGEPGQRFPVVVVAHDARGDL